MERQEDLSEQEGVEHCDREGNGENREEETRIAVKL